MIRFITSFLQRKIQLSHLLGSKARQTLLPQIISRNWSQIQGIRLAQWGFQIWFPSIDTLKEKQMSLETSDENKSFLRPEERSHIAILIHSMMHYSLTTKIESLEEALFWSLLLLKEQVPVVLFIADLGIVGQSYNYPQTSVIHGLLALLLNWFQYWDFWYQSVSIADTKDAIVAAYKSKLQG